MPVTFNDFTNATTMSASAVQTEVQRAAEYINGEVLNADMANAEVQTAHILRPEIYGFPVNGAQMVSQAIYWRNVTGDSWDMRWNRRRFDIYPKMAYETTNRGVPILMASIPIDEPLPADGGASIAICVTATWSCRVLFNQTVVGSGEKYAGYFILNAKARNAPGYAPIAHSRRPIQTINDTQRQATKNRFNTMGIMTLDGSAFGGDNDLRPQLFDVWLEWQRDGAVVASEQGASQMLQLCIGNRYMKVEVFRTQA